MSLRVSGGWCIHVCLGGVGFSSICFCNQFKPDSIKHEPNVVDLYTRYIHLNGQIFKNCFSRENSIFVLVWFWDTPRTSDALYGLRPCTCWLVPFIWFRGALYFSRLWHYCNIFNRDVLRPSMTDGSPERSGGVCTKCSLTWKHAWSMKCCCRTILLVTLLCQLTRHVSFSKTHLQHKGVCISTNYYNGT